MRVLCVALVVLDVVVLVLEAVLVVAVAAAAVAIRTGPGGRLLVVELPSELLHVRAQALVQVHRQGPQRVDAVGEMKRYEVLEPEGCNQLKKVEALATPSKMYVL